MTIGIYFLSSDHNKDTQAILSESVDIYGTTGSLEYDYDEETATFVAGTTYAKDYTYVYYEDVTSSPTDVDAEIQTSEMLVNKSIIPFFTILDIFLKTGISTGSVVVKKLFDLFTDEPSESNTINMYNDVYEINSGVTTARVNGSRSSIIHNHIPVRIGEGKGASVVLEIQNEGEIHDLQFRLAEGSEEGGV